MEDRLARVEKKLDDLQVAIINLARVEERLVTVFNRQESLEHKLESLETLLAKLSTKVGSAWAERLFWIVVVAGVSYLSNNL